MLQLTRLILIAFLCSSCNSHKTSKQSIASITDTSSSHFDTSSNPLYWRFISPHNPIQYMPHFSLVQTDSSQINISFFDTIPETISPKMGEFYSYDTTKLADNKYIFLTTLTNYGVIKINGKDVYLDKKHDKCVALLNDTYKDVYVGNGFSVIMTHKLIDSNNGVSNEIGTLEIKNSKYQAAYKIHGGYRIP
jgi:hypothetical protein